MFIYPPEGVSSALRKLHEVEHVPQLVFGEGARVPVARRSAAPDKPCRLAGWGPRWRRGFLAEDLPEASEGRAESLRELDREA